MIVWFLSILLVYVLPAYLAVGIVIATVQMASLRDVRVFLLWAFLWAPLAAAGLCLWLLFWMTGASHDGYGDFYGD